MPIEDRDLPPPPPDALKVDVWEDHDGEVKRFFRGTQRGKQVRVEITGFQNANGVVERHISVQADENLDVADVQVLIDDLVAARDEVNRLANSSGAGY